MSRQVRTRLSRVARSLEMSEKTSRSPMGVGRRQKRRLYSSSTPVSPPAAMTLSARSWRNFPSDRS